MAHIIEKKIVFEIEDDKSFETYMEEWVNNNSYARYQIIDEDYIKEYWTDEKKQNIEDILEMVFETDDYTVYKSRYAIFYMADEKNRIRLAYDRDKDEVLYARGVKCGEMMRWITNVKEIGQTIQNSLYYEPADDIQLPEEEKNSIL